MKKLYITIIAVLIGASSFAQRVSVSNADKLFEQRDFEEASEMYRLITDKDQEVLQNLADSYYYTNRMEKAEEYYRQLLNNYGPGVAPEYKFRFAQTLRALGKNQEADQQLSEYFGRRVNFEEWEEKMDTITPYIYNTSQPLSSGSISNFGVTFIGENEVVLASTRNQDRPIYEWNNKPYLDLYMADYDNGSLSNFRLLPGDVNTDTHESSPTLNRDGTIMYFDRTNSKRVRDRGEGTRVAHISVMRAELVEGEWTNIERVPFASDHYTTEHPSLNSDGTKLYFASNMPGTIGSYDIYVVEVHDDGSFGDPQNLGPEVNTSEREQFPYISDEDVLYFSSNGRVGYGNLDLFRSEMEDGAFTEAENLGAINSAYDDFAYTLQKGEDRGFFTSNRNGNESLFSFTREQRPEPSVAPEEIVETNVKTGAQQLRDIDDIYFDLDESVILPEAERALDKVVEIMKEYPDLQIEIGSHADIRGTEQYNMNLSEERAQATLEYILSQGIEEDRITARGYGENMPLNDCSEDEDDDCSEEEHALNRRSEFKVLN